MVLSLISSAWFPLDLSAHQGALLLAGNLLAGTNSFRLDQPVTPWLFAVIFEKSIHIFEFFKEMFKHNLLLVTIKLFIYK